jgi:GAF domain-containing protein
MRRKDESRLVGSETLYAIIGAIAEGPDLDRVLRAVVDLLVDATACHACFVYLREGDLLRIRAASPVFAHVVGRVTLRLDEGLTGWVARNRTPAFIREDALSDPRMQYVPELEEERFQSMIAVPLIDRQGDVIGVVVLHTQAPREFGRDVLDLLVHVASLVVGAIENARLYGETRRQVAALSTLSDLSQTFASLTRREELYAAGCTGIGRLVDAQDCELSIINERGHAIPASTFQADDGDDGQRALVPSAGRLTVYLVEGGRRLGLINVSRQAPFTSDDARLLETATNQLVLALRTAELIERLAAENLVRQVFEALQGGSLAAATARARAAGWNPHRPHVAVVAMAGPKTAGSWEQVGPEVERRLRAAAGDALVDLGPDELRALTIVPGTLGGDVRGLVDLCAQLAQDGSELGVSFGISQPRPALATDAQLITEADVAARVARALQPTGGARAYDNLGPYRFLVSMIGSPPPDQAHAGALRQLADYDARRGADLIDTLEAYLTARGGARATADTLFIHPNTLRQRLERIEAVSGLELSTTELLSLELSIKFFRLSAT